MTNYNPLTPEIVAKLEQIVGASNVIFDEESLRPTPTTRPPRTSFRGCRK